MWTAGGQVDHLSFAGQRGGGGKGGGGGGNYTPPTPRSFTDPVNGQVFSEDFSRPGWAEAALNNEIQARKNQELEDTKTKQAAADAEKATGKATFDQRNQASYDYALQNATKAFQNAGVDPNTYMQSDIIPALMAKKNTIQDLDPNPSATYGDNLGTDIVNQVLGGKRTGATNQINAMFTPNYSQMMLGDSLASSYTDTLLGEQFNPLRQQLENASKRRTLSPTGYQAALDTLGQKESSARSQINTLGQGILDADRGALDQYTSGARSSAGGLTLADTFDPNTYAEGAKNLVSKDVADFGGALRTKVGGTKFADINELINAGGAIQGSVNPSATNPLSAQTGGSPSSAAQDELQKQKRGLGSQGAF